MKFWQKRRKLDWTWACSTLLCLTSWDTNQQFERKLKNPRIWLKKLILIRNCSTKFEFPSVFHPNRFHFSSSVSIFHLLFRCSNNKKRKILNDLNGWLKFIALKWDKWTRFILISSAKNPVKTIYKDQIEFFFHFIVNHRLRIFFDSLNVAFGILNYLYKKIIFRNEFSCYFVLLFLRKEMKITMKCG